ncbi:hypothetical protein K491DRAFT_720112 [Lophiostoma macrostomum CBS 122681]|uniref:Uncharacterized protein n=1 Tax=Lophiostoma macrostomum CBS 122681 TaxID=1314788 RepID=A0A6A6SU98_9PLEO|nr:hypothetical protein K491DRAFT_720112 [Lophiostoma macrostomum CBS 122681]
MTEMYTLQSGANAKTLEQMRSELGHNRDMLSLLPHEDAHFSDNHEVAAAVTKKLRLGVRAADPDSTIWMYLYPPKISNSSTKLISGYDVYGSDHVIQFENKVAIDQAILDPAFQHIPKKPEIITAVCKYYFVIAGVDIQRRMVVTDRFTHDLMTACSEIQFIASQATRESLRLSAGENTSDSVDGDILGVQPEEDRRSSAVPHDSSHMQTPELSSTDSTMDELEYVEGDHDGSTLQNPFAIEGRAQAIELLINLHEQEKIHQVETVEKERELERVTAEKREIEKKGDEVQAGIKRVRGEFSRDELCEMYFEMGGRKKARMESSSA